MRIENLRKAIGEIDDDLIEEADRTPSPRRRTSRWIWIGSIAAAFVLILSTVLILPRLLNHDGPAPYVPADLELLSFRIVDEGAPRLSNENEEGIILLSTESGENEQTVEPIDHGVKRFCATVKNMERVPFIDLVVFLSWRNTAVVFNEGHGDFQCASTTVFEDGEWVTNIEFDLEPEFDENFEAKVEILQISFLGSDNSLKNASIIDSNVSGKKLALVYNSDFSLQVDGIRYQIVFANEQVYAIAEAMLSSDADILQSVTYSDHEGTHICPVTVIGKSFFSSHNEIRTFTIPQSVFSLENGLFDECNQLDFLSFEGTVEEWTQRFGDLSLNRPCLSIYCSDGETSVGEHVPGIMLVSFDPDSMTCTIQDRFCQVCGQLVEHGREEALLPMTQKSLLLKTKAQITDDVFMSTGNFLISPFRNGFDEPVDLSDLFALSITFQVDDLDALQSAKSGQLELTSSGKQDQQEIHWELTGAVFKNCQKIAGNKYRIMLCIANAIGFDIGEESCDLSKINYIRMYMEIPDGASKIRIKVNEIALYTTESVLEQNNHKIETEDPVQMESHKLVLTECSDDPSGWASGSMVTDNNTARDYLRIGPFSGTNAIGTISATFRLPDRSDEQTPPYLNPDGYRFFCFDLYVPDVSQVQGKKFTLELASGEEIGKNGRVLTLPIESFFDYEMRNGWNHAVIGMDCQNWTNTEQGLIDWSQINSFRFFNAETVSLSSNCFLGFDDLYFWDGLASGYEYSFQTGSGLDNPYVISSTGKINTGDFYYNDLNMETVLKFHLEDATNVERVELTMKTGGQLALYVSGDGENWDTVFKCFIPSEVKSFGGLAVMTRYYDLTEYVDLDSSQDVYVKIGDAFTEDGFGGRLYDVSLQIGQKHN